MKYKSILVLIIAQLISAVSPAKSVLDNPNLNVQAFDLLTSEIERLDASAIQLHQNRSKTWFEIKKELRYDLLKAESSEQIARVFYRLDQSYSNSHAYMDIDPDLTESFPLQPLSPSIEMGYDWLSLSQTRVRIKSLHSEIHDYGKTSKAPQVGDEIIAINGRSLNFWLDENFNFCKQTLKTQCLFEFQHNFYSQILGWSSTEPILYTLKRGSKHWDVPVYVKAIARPPSIPASKFCFADPGRYNGFKLVYSGNRACIFQSLTDSAIAVLRISSFSYKGAKGLVQPSHEEVVCSTDEKKAIGSIPEEVECLGPWWIQNAKWKHLVIDVTDNLGGNDPAPYYKLIFNKPIQEDQVQIKKFAELTDPSVNSSVFYDQEGMRSWFNDLKQTATWDQISVGDLLPSISVYCYCPESNVACNDYSIKPYAHSFDGKVSVLLNHKCVSSCDGFVWLLQSRLAERGKFYGLPNAADGAWGMVNVDIIFDEISQSFKSNIRSLDAEPNPKVVISQVVVVTSSVDRSGRILDGIPVNLNKFVSFDFANPKDWLNKALQAAIRTN